MTRSPLVRSASPLLLAAALATLPALTAVAPGLLATGAALLPAAARAADAPLPWVAGEVRKVDAEKLRVVLKHDTIPNMDMPPMTMSFKVADAKLLAGLKAGDRVKFAAKMAGDDMVVVKLERAP